MGVDVLEPLAAEDLAGLLEVLERDLPRSAMVINWVRVQSAWQAADPGLELQILRPSRRSGTLVGLSRGGELGDGVFAVMYATSDQAGVSELSSVLLRSQLVPWPDLQGVIGVLEAHEPVVLAALAARGLGAFLSPVDIYHMPAHQAAQIQVPRPPPEAHVTPLRAHHEDAVCRLWGNFTEHKRPLVRAMLRHNRSAGVEVAGRLVSMVLEAHYGGLGLLATEPEYRGRGFGGLVLAGLTRDLGLSGDDPVVLVSPASKAALKVTARLGFEHVARGTFVTVTS